jgi:methionyl-tRNA formyltransferase
VLRIVFFGNSESSYSNRYFQAFQDAACEVVAVVDTPPARRGSTTAGVQCELTGFVTIARQQGIAAFEPTSPNLPEFGQAVKALVPDLFVAAGYMGVFKEAALAVPRLLAVNFHASLLPAYRGKHPVFWALRNGERWSGLTVHVVDRGLDTGDILYQVKVRTRRNDTPAALYDRIVARSLWLPSRLVRDAEQGTLPRRPQPCEGVSYHSSVDQEDFRLDWSWPAERLRRMIRVSPGRCFADVAGYRLLFQGGEVVPNVDRVPAGTLLRLDRAGGLVKCGDGALRVRCTAADDSNARTFPELCRQLGIQPGALLST